MASCSLEQDLEANSGFSILPSTNLKREFDNATKKKIKSRSKLCFHVTPNFAELGCIILTKPFCEKALLGIVNVRFTEVKRANTKM